VLARGSDGDGAGGTARVVERLGLHLADNILGGLVGNLTENGVLSIKMRGLDEGDEELGAYFSVRFVTVDVL
jgi:hypothetical protein